MKFEILFLGKTREKYLEQGIRDYAERLRRYIPLEIKTIKLKHGRNDPDQVIMKREADLLLNRTATGYLVALNPAGREQRSEEIAEAITGWENRGLQTITFLIGGHLGLADKVLKRADLNWSLSRLTFTHEMSRFILIEQLYRACSIKEGHNYHK